MPKVEKTFDELVADAKRKMAVTRTAKMQVDAERRKDGSFLADALRQSTDRKVVALFGAFTTANAENEYATHCVALGYVPPVATVEGATVAPVAPVLAS